MRKFQMCFKWGDRQKKHRQSHAHALQRLCAYMHECVRVWDREPATGMTATA